MRIKKNRYIKLWLLILSYVFVFCLSFAATTFFMQRYDVKITPKVQQPGVKGCSMEALLCPDGTAVGRSGPNCEFAKCPTVQVTPQKGLRPISTFEDCAGAGYPVMESYPATCSTPDGKRFIQKVSATPDLPPPGYNQ